MIIQDVTDARSLQEYINGFVDEISFVAHRWKGNDIDSLSKWDY